MSKTPSNNAITAWIQLHRTHRVLLEKVEHSLKESGFPPLDWYDVLLELNREPKAGLRQFEIGERVLLNKHNLSRLIDRLEKEKLVGRFICAEDGRANRIQITPKGEKLLKQAWPVYQQSIQDNFASKLSAEEIKAMSIIMLKLLNPISKY